LFGRRRITAVIDRLRDRVADPDAAVAHRHAGDGGEHALGHRIGGIDEARVAELGDDIAFVDHDAVGSGAPGGHRAQAGTEDGFLVGQVERTLGLARLRELDGRGQGRRVHAQLGRVLAGPFAGRWKIGCLVGGEHAGGRQRQAQCGGEGECEQAAA